MVWMRHKGCSTPVVEYIGAEPLASGPLMRQADWKDVDGKPARMRFLCPDCGSAIGIHAGNIETCDGSPYRYAPKPRPTKPAIFDRLRAVFSFLKA